MEANAALIAPSISLFLMLALFVGGRAGAQMPTSLVFVNQHCSEDTLRHNHEAGYLRFVSSTGRVVAVLSATETPDSVYFERFQVTQGTLAPVLRPVALQAELGFQALHSHAGLARIVDFYWTTFVGFGYAPTVVAVTPVSVEYLFASGVGEYRAVFTKVDGRIDVSFTPVATLVASRKGAPAPAVSGSS